MALLRVNLGGRTQDLDVTCQDPLDARRRPDEERTRLVGARSKVYLLQTLSGLVGNAPVGG